jgi:hypothetical protein
MATDEELPSEVIERTFAGCPEGACADLSIELLQILANSLGNIIGEDGFEAWLFRTVRRIGTCALPTRSSSMSACASKGKRRPTSGTPVLCFLVPLSIFWRWWARL